MPVRQLQRGGAVRGIECDVEAATRPICQRPRHQPRLLRPVCSARLHPMPGYCASVHIGAPSQLLVRSPARMMPC